MNLLTKLREAEAKSPEDAPPPDPAQAQHDRIMRDGPSSRDDWGFYIEKIIGPILKQQFGTMKDLKGVLVKNHVNPIDASWRVYCTALAKDIKFRDLTNKYLAKMPSKMVFHAPRSGAKTLGLAIIAHTLCYFHAGYSISYTATQDQQVNEAWKYLREFNLNDIDGKPNVFAGKSVKVVNALVQYSNKSSISRVHCTPGGLNSKHPNMLIVDEVETANWNVLIEGIFSGQSREAERRPMLYLFASTQKQPRATMFMLFRECVAGKAVLFRWNWKTVVERCPKFRREDLPHGVKCSDYALLAAEREKLESNAVRTPVEEQELLRTSHEMDCLEENCRLVPKCKGIAIKGQGYKSIKDLIEFLDAGEEAFDAQMGCEQPSMTNAVYPMLSTENSDFGVIYNPGAHQYGFVDYGHAIDPTAIGIVGMAGSRIEHWYEKECKNLDDEAVMVILQDLAFRYDVEMWAVSPEASQLKSKMIAAGMIIYAKKSPIAIGVGNLSHYIKSGHGTVLYKVNTRQCPRTWEQLQTYYRGESGMPTTKRQMGQFPHHWDFCEGLRYLANMFRAGDMGESLTTKTTWRTYQ